MFNDFNALGKLYDQIKGILVNDYPWLDDPAPVKIAAGANITLYAAAPIGQSYLWTTVQPQPNQTAVIDNGSGSSETIQILDVYQVYPPAVTDPWVLIPYNDASQAPWHVNLGGPLQAAYGVGSIVLPGEEGVQVSNPGESVGNGAEVAAVAPVQNSALGYYGGPMANEKLLTYQRGGQQVVGGRMIDPNMFHISGGAPNSSTLGSSSLYKVDPYSTVTNGRVRFGTGATVAAGQLGSVTFSGTQQRPPMVQIQAENQATANLGNLWVSVTTTGFTFGCQTAPLANQALGVYSVNWSATL